MGRVLHGQHMGHGVDGALGRLVGDGAARTQRRGRGDVDDRSRLFLAHHRQDMLAGHEHGLQVELKQLVPHVGLKFRRRLVAARPAHVVVQHVDAAVTVGAGRCDGAAIIFLAHVGLKGRSLAADVGDHFQGVGGAGFVIIDDQHGRPFLGEAEGGGAAVADGLARLLAATDDDGDLVFQSHAWMLPRVFFCIQCRKYIQPYTGWSMAKVCFRPCCPSGVTRMTRLSRTRLIQPS